MAKLASGSFLQQYFTGLRFFSKTSLSATRASAEQRSAPDPAPVPQPHGPARQRPAPQTQTCCPNPIGERGSDVRDAWQGKWKSLPGGLGLAKVEAHIEGGQQVMKLGSRSGSVLPDPPLALQSLTESGVDSLPPSPPCLTRLSGHLSPTTPPPPLSLTSPFPPGRESSTVLPLLVFALASCVSKGVVSLASSWNHF